MSFFTVPSSFTLDRNSISFEDLLEFLSVKNKTKAKKQFKYENLEISRKRRPFFAC